VTYDDWKTDVGPQPNASQGPKCLKCPSPAVRDRRCALHLMRAAIEDLIEDLIDECVLGPEP
jgi:hypothetical protein